MQGYAHRACGYLRSAHCRWPSRAGGPHPRGSSESTAGCCIAASAPAWPGRSRPGCPLPRPAGHTPALGPLQHIQPQRQAVYYIVLNLLPGQVIHFNCRPSSASSPVLRRQLPACAPLRRTEAPGPHCLSDIAAVNHELRSPLVVDSQRGLSRHGGCMLQRGRPESWERSQPSRQCAFCGLLCQRGNGRAGHGSQLGSWACGPDYL